MDVARFATMRYEWMLPDLLRCVMRGKGGKTRRIWGFVIVESPPTVMKKKAKALQIVVSLMKIL